MNLMSHFLDHVTSHLTLCKSLEDTVKKLDF
uniref:Uncharacterized protein n=1 Tax=Anguilla anguilla TaxID=7936 RepID=A0A0E9VDF0_ANGAN